MSGFTFVCTAMLLGIGGAILIALLSTEGSEDVEKAEAFAVLPVPENTPSARAFLEHYASQIAWMDAKVLRCVILVSIPETHALCEELARDYECYTAMTLGEVQALLAKQCGITENSGSS